jgi:nucleoside-diphosphate-sugar epimerase
MRFTVLGADGFIGSALVLRLLSLGHDAVAIGRSDPAPVDAADLGHVIYAIGVTSDFRSRPDETVEAHVCVVNQFLADANFESFLYLSSTRLYANSDFGAEDARIALDVRDPDALYNATKIAGESRCLALPDPNVRVARLSNLIGVQQSAETFVGRLIRQALDGLVRLPESPETTRDYVALDEALDLLVAIATTGNHRLYNVASGSFRSTADIIEILVSRTSCTVEVPEDAARRRYAAIDMSRAVEEFGHRLSDGIDHLPTVIDSVRAGT